MQALLQTMKTDGSPPHCIIHKYGFLKVSITLHCECAHAHMCMYFKCVFAFEHMLTLWWPFVFDIRWMCMLTCVLKKYCSTASLCLYAVYQHNYSPFRFVYVQYMSVCTYASVSQVEFFFYSPMCGKNSLLIKLLSLSLSIFDLSGVFYS